MSSPDIKIHRIGFEKAVAYMNFDCELRRTSWSIYPQDDDFHHSLRIDNTGRLMAVSGQGHCWSEFSLTVNDVLAKDWEVRRVKC